MWGMTKGIYKLIHTPHSGTVKQYDSTSTLDQEYIYIYMIYERDPHYNYMHSAMNFMLNKTKSEKSKIKNIFCST